MRKLIIVAIFFFISGSLFSYCTLPVTLSNSNICCVSGLSSNPADISAYVWLQGKADWTNNSTSTTAAAPGTCFGDGGCDSDGVMMLDTDCSWDASTILVPDAGCINECGTGAYFLNTNWVTSPSGNGYDGCPSNLSTERAVLLAYDTTGKYILQSKSQSGTSWTGWDDIGTTTANVFSAPTGRWVGFGFPCSVDQEVDIECYPLPDSVKYGTYAPGDAPSSPIVTGFRLYFNTTTPWLSPPTDFRTSAWIAGNVYPIDTTTINNCIIPNGTNWISRSLIFEGKELPFVSTQCIDIRYLGKTEASVSDLDPCACSGIGIWAESCYEDYQILVDGTDCFFSTGSGQTRYNGTCGVTHTFQVRCFDLNWYGSWGDPVIATDNYQTAPSTPSITSIIDNNPYGKTGITINYTPGIPAYRHDLYRNGSLVQSGFASGSTYSGGDCNDTYNYAIAAISDSSSCYTTFSTSVEGMDVCLPPPEIAIGDTPDDAQFWSSDKVIQFWPAFIGATGYKIYRGTPDQLANLPLGTVNSCTRYNGMDTSIDLSGDAPPPESFFWYIVTAYNDSGEGSAGPGRIINSDGDCH